VDDALTFSVATAPRISPPGGGVLSEVFPRLKNEVAVAYQSVTRERAALMLEDRSN
jgi:hypothetical protein